MVHEVARTDRVVVCPLHGHTYDLATRAEVADGDGVRTYHVTADDDALSTSTPIPLHRPAGPIPRESRLRGLRCTNRQHAVDR